MKNIIPLSAHNFGSSLYFVSKVAYMMISDWLTLNNVKYFTLTVYQN